MVVYIAAKVGMSSSALTHGQTMDSKKSAQWAVTTITLEEIDMSTEIVPGTGAVVAVQNSPQLDSLLQRLSYLETALNEQDPMMRNHLKEIHSTLIQHEELVHLLDDEQIAIIMQGQQVITNTTLVAAVTAPKARAANAKKAAQLSLGDL